MWWTCVGQLTISKFSLNSKANGHCLVIWRDKRERERERQVRVECEVLLSVSNNGIIANTQTHTIMYASTHTVCVFVCTYMHACVVGQIK